jgi:hypothetical protein
MAEAIAAFGNLLDHRVNTLRGSLALMMLAVIAGCSNAPMAGAPPIEIRISQSWNGDYPVAELRRLPAGQQESAAGYLGSAAAFESVWTVFKPGEAVPAINFGENMVVFHRNVDFYNRTRIFKVTLKDGVAEVLAMETLSAMPIADKVAMAMAVIPRAGVKYLQSGPVRITVSTK